MLNSYHKCKEIILKFYVQNYLNDNIFCFFSYGMLVRNATTYCQLDSRMARLFIKKCVSEISLAERKWQS